MLSIWERNSFIQYHHLIIGAGIVGLTTAWYLKQRFPNHRILVLERGLMPSGASTKNAGFACMGSLTELLDNLSLHTEQEVIDLFLLRKRGLERLQHLLGRDAMGYAAQGSYELLFEKDLSALQQIDLVNRVLADALRMNAFRICNDKISEFGFAQPTVQAMIENNCEGEIDTGLMMQNLISKVQTAGIDIRTGAQVMTYTEHQHCVEVMCKDPLSRGEITFRAEQVFICNNAFAKTLLPEADIMPGRGQVLITHAIPQLKFKGVFHFDQGYYYFRAYRQCVLFGGGRNLDFDTEATIDFSINERIQQDLDEKLKAIILPDQDFSIDLRWTGIMAFGTNKRPILEQVSERVFAGVRMGGMGVAIGSEIGYQLSEML